MQSIPGCAGASIVYLLIFCYYCSFSISVAVVVPFSCNKTASWHQSSSNFLTCSVFPFFSNKYENGKMKKGKSQYVAKAMLQESFKNFVEEIREMMWLLALGKGPMEPGLESSFHITRALRRS